MNDFIVWLLAELKQHENAVNALKDISTVVLAVVGLAFLGWRTWVMQRSAKAAEKQVEIAENNFTLSKETSEKNQQNDQFVKAIDQLGSDDIAVRLGGIYSLEQLAHASDDFYRQIIEVLTAYVREHAIAPKSQEGYKPKQDVQATLTVLGRAGNNGRFEFDLGGCYLSKYNISGDFKKASFRGCELTNANCASANFTKASCSNANFTQAYCSNADFTKASCSNANFTKADCSNADFSKAFCLDANFTGAIILSANFAYADCPIANLTSATCAQTNFAYANCAHANFTDANCERANFTDANCVRTNFADAVCAEANFTNADCAEANFTSACLIRANFTSANLLSTKFTGALCDGAIGLTVNSQN